MFGISGGEFIVIVLIAAFVLGPKNVAQAVVGFEKSWKKRAHGALGFVKRPRWTLVRLALTPAM